jgi:K+-sensing histidine kinase KdpD
LATASSPKPEGGRAPELGASATAALLWACALAGVTLVLWRYRETLSEAHKTLALLLVVLGASARSGRSVGLGVAMLAFFAFNFFLLPPYYTFHLVNPLDWTVLGGFLLTGAVAAQLFHTVQESRAMVERGARDVAALKEADRLKDAVIASVSHDLRTPLTTIRALASEMRETEGERALVIEEEAERLNRLVGDMLDLSRIRVGGVVPDLQIVAAEDVVGAALQRLAGVAGSDRVVVRLPPDGSLPVGRMDVVHALRALCNLLENALRHTPANQPVELEVRIEGPLLLFLVMDRGPGIPEADRERMFEPFARRSGPLGRGGGSTGLGLAIARSLADAQHGTLEFTPREGGGSVFRLSFPAESIPELGE